MSTVRPPPQNKILMTTSFLTNSFKFLGQLSPFDQNTVVATLVVLKLTCYSFLVKMLL